MRIVLDTNSLFDDPVMVRQDAERVLRLLKPAEATLVFSPVVRAELERKRQDDVKDLRRTIFSRVRKLSALGGVDSKKLVTGIDDLARAATQRWTERWEEISALPQVEFAPWPTINAQSMAERELGRRRPFLDKEAGTVGHRDALIWLTVLELAEEDPTEEIVLVTADQGFLSKGGLHEHLIQDLVELGANGIVTHTTSLARVAELLQSEADQSGWEAWREAAAASVLHDELRALDSGAFTPKWDERSGGTLEPTFDIGLSTIGDDWELADVDGPENLVLEHAPYGAGDITCTFKADLYLSGFMDKSEWYSDDHPEVNLWDADWNDHVVSVEAERRVEFTARLHIDDDDETLTLDEIVDAHIVPGPDALTIG